MARVYERLKHERESRNTTIEEISVASGIGQSYLEALERGEIDALPGPAFGKLYIRAYAEVLGFDPQPWIEAYDRERRLLAGPATEPAPHGPASARPVAAALARWQETLTAESAEPVAETPPEIVEAEPEHGGRELVDPERETPIPHVEETPLSPFERLPDPVPESRPSEFVVNKSQDKVSGPRINKLAATVAAFVLVIVAIASWIYLGGQPKVVPVSATHPAESLPQQQSAPPDPPPPVRTEPKPPPKAKPPVAAPASDPGVLTVAESGLGRRVVESRLAGEGTQFTEGEVVVFQTRVLHGIRGDVVRHVWIYDGRAQQGITLRIGAADWRTHSKKTILKTGPWTVEVRDRNGRVLASASFTCVPR